MWKRIGIIALGLTVLVAGCGAPAQPRSDVPAAAPETNSRSQGPKRITVAIQGDPPTVNEDINSAGGRGGTPGGGQLELLVSAGLVVEDDRRTLQPQLGEAVPTVENGLWKVHPDGRMETPSRIRDGARWHDGTPLTSADLLFSARVGQDKDLTIRRALGWDFVESVEAVDARTVTVRWKRLFIQADTLFDSFLVPAHFLETAHGQDKEAFIQLPYWTQEYVGTGPFQVREWAGGSHTLLAAFDGYVLGRPKIDEIEVRFIPDSNTLHANVLAGAIDLTVGRGLSVEQAIQLRDQWKDGGFDVTVGSSWIAAHPQLLNPTPAAVADVRFRRALVHAVDRRELADSLLGGLVGPAESFLPPSDSMYKDVEASVVRYEHDQRRAAQMLEELGFTRGPDGMFRDATGQRLEMEIRSIAVPEQQAKVAVTTSDYWQRLGIATQPIPIPPQRARDVEWRANFPAFEVAQQPIGLQSNAIRRLHGSEASLPENNYRGNNRTRYMNPEFDAMVDRFFATVPRAERVAIVRDIVRHLSDQVVPMGLLYVAEPSMRSNRLEGVTGGSPWNAHEWQLK
jgi:peptide/nickel transport system substrate-binding protein